MHRSVLSLIVIVLLAAPLVAQQQQPPRRMRVPADKIQSLNPTSQKAEQPKQVPIEQKLRYIVRQLDLDAKQKQHAEGLFAILQAESNLSPDEIKELLERIASTNRAMQEAEKAGDPARAEELRKELQGLAPGAAAERHFVDGLIPVLNEQQKEKVRALLVKLEKATDLSLKPIEIIRLAKDLNLMPEQAKQIDKLQEEFRQSTAAGKASDSQALDKLISDISALLNPTQRATFEREIAQRRIDEPTAAAASTQPAPKP